MRMEVTLKSGTMIWANVKSVRKENIPGFVNRLVWTNQILPGEPSLVYLDLDQVAAVVTYGSADVEAVQDERDDEEAEAGGDQVEPGRNIEGRDAE